MSDIQFTEYEWKVTWLHNMGFSKSFTVRSINYDEAVMDGEMILKSCGYDPGEMIVTEIKRGEVTRQAYGKGN